MPSDPSVDNGNATSLSIEDRQELGLLGIKPSKEIPVVTIKEDRPRNSDGTYAPRPEAAPEATVTSQAKHPRHLYDAAIYFGYTEEDADGFSTGQLSKMLWKMNQVRNHEREQQALIRMVEPKPPVQSQQVQPPEASEDYLDLEGEIDPTLNPKLVKVLKDLLKEKNDLKKQLAAVSGTVQTATASAHTQLVDQAIASLGEAGKAIFGEGDFNDFAVDTPEHDLRKMLYIKSGLNGSGTKKQIDAAIKAAFTNIRQAFGGQAGAAASTGGYEDVVQPAKAQPKRITPKEADEWERDGPLPLPSRRESDELPDGDEKAVRNLAKKMGKQPAQYDEDKAIRETLLRRNGVA